MIRISNWAVAGIVFLLVMFAGKPDLMDAIIARLMRP